MTGYPGRKLLFAEGASNIECSTVVLDSPLIVCCGRFVFSIAI